MKSQLEQIIGQLSLLHFEVILIAGALLLLILGLVVKNNLSQRIGFCLVLVVALLFQQYSNTEQVILTGALKLGPLESFIKTLIVVFAIWIVFFANAKKRAAEFYFLILSIVIGSVFMVSANHLLVVYIAIELTSFTSYIITNFNFQKRSFEAGIKYLLFGGVSSAIMLYGISIIYGLGGSLAIDELNLSSDDPFLAFGIFALLGGLFFKVSVFPFHIWTPSAYQEAPPDAVAVLAVVPKIAGFVLLHRILSMIDLESIVWVLPLLILVGIATIVVGTLGALGQSDVKRLMAYGAITHSGLLLGCLVINGQTGITAFVWYVLIYAIMNLVLFYLISVFEEKNITTVQDFSGVGLKAPFISSLVVIVMISLIGLPPTAGFTAKFYLFSALWNEFQVSSDLYIFTFLLVGILSVIFSLFYYLKIPYYSFIQISKKEINLKLDVFQNLFATILVTFLLWFFFSPEILDNIVVYFNNIDW
ncbi:MAG: NADH-quinone oxidoreductase subunit N [Cyclobacteriaceae bacterium]|jgi:NADH-quinone oxidoreductase subunit N